MPAKSGGKPNKIWSLLTACYGRRGRYDFIQNKKSKVSRGFKSLKRVISRSRRHRAVYLTPDPSVESLFLPPTEHGAHPVLNICLGFDEEEFSRGWKLISNSYHQSRLDRIAEFSKYYEVPCFELREIDPIVDDLPASVWMECIEPTLDVLISLNHLRHRRSNLSRKRKYDEVIRQTLLMVTGAYTTFNLSSLFPCMLTGNAEETQWRAPCRGGWVLITVPSEYGRIRTARTSARHEHGDFDTWNRFVIGPQIPPPDFDDDMRQLGPTDEILPSRLVNSGGLILMEMHNLLEQRIRLETRFRNQNRRRAMHPPYTGYNLQRELLELEERTSDTIFSALYEEETCGSTETHSNTTINCVSTAEEGNIYQDEDELHEKTENLFYGGYLVNDESDTDINNDCITKNGIKDNLTNNDPNDESQQFQLGLGIPNCVRGTCHPLCLDIHTYSQPAESAVVLHTRGGEGSSCDAAIDCSNHHTAEVQDSILDHQVKTLNGSEVVHGIYSVREKEDILNVQTTPSGQRQVDYSNTLSHLKSNSSINQNKGPGAYNNQIQTREDIDSNQVIDDIQSTSLSSVTFDDSNNMNQSANTDDSEDSESDSETSSSSSSEEEIIEEKPDTWFWIPSLATFIPRKGRVVIGPEIKTFETNWKTYLSKISENKMETKDGLHIATVLNRAPITRFMFLKDLCVLLQTIDDHSKNEKPLTKAEQMFYKDLPSKYSLKFEELNKIKQNLNQKQRVKRTSRPLKIKRKKTLKSRSRRSERRVTTTKKETLFASVSTHLNDQEETSDSDMGTLSPLFREASKNESESEASEEGYVICDILSNTSCLSPSHSGEESQSSDSTISQTAKRVRVRRIRVAPINQPNKAITGPILIPDISSSGSNFSEDMSYPQKNARYECDTTDSEPSQGFKSVRTTGRGCREKLIKYRSKNLPAVKQAWPENSTDNQINAESSTAVSIISQDSVNNGGQLQNGKVVTRTLFKSARKASARLLHIDRFRNAFMRLKSYFNK